MASPLKLKSNLDTIMDDETKVSPFKNKRRHGQSNDTEESPNKMTRSSERHRRRQEHHTPYAKFKSDGSRKRQRDDNIERYMSLFSIVSFNLCKIQEYLEVHHYQEEEWLEH